MNNLRTLLKVLLNKIKHKINLQNISSNNSKRKSKY